MRNYLCDERGKPVTGFRAIIYSKPHAEQRYPTVGDWIDSTDEFGPFLHVYVSEMPDWRHVALVAVHELVEAILCRHRGIAEAAVTAFDEKFEERRHPDDDSEPGDDPEAPYRREHFFATNVERLLAAELGVDWSEYAAAVEAL